jgi:hypothetical protein
MSGLENRDYGLRGSAALTMRHPSPQKLALTSPASGGRSVGIVRSRTKATEVVNRMTTSVVLWSAFLATDPEAQVRFPALPDFLRSSGSGTGSTQSREYN